MIQGQQTEIKEHVEMAANQNNVINETGESNKLEMKQPEKKLMLRVKRKANEDPLEKLILEGELVRKRVKLNPMFSLEKMLGDLSLSSQTAQATDTNKAKNGLDQADNQECVQIKNQVKQQGLFDGLNDAANDEPSKEKKRYVLTLVTEEEARLRESKQNAAEDARKKARGKRLHQSRQHRMLELKVDETACQVKVEQAKEREDTSNTYAYYEVQEEKEEEELTISQMLDKEIKNNLYVMRVESGIGHLNANQGCGLFEGEFTSDNDIPSSDKESEDSNRESAEENDYPEEDENDDSGSYDQGQRQRNDMNDSYEDQDDYDSDCERKPKRNMLSNCANGLHIGDDSNNEDEDDDEFTRKYNKHYHKHFDNDYNDEDFD